METALRVEIDGVTHLIPDTDIPPIILVDDQNRRVDEAPKVVNWRGMLGAFSKPETANVAFNSDDCFGSDTVDGKCRELAIDLTGVRIPAWPYLAQTHPVAPNKLYGGSIGLDWMQGAFQTCCDDPGTGGAGVIKPEPGGFNDFPGAGQQSSAVPI
jgi:hypothetical protein